MRSLKSGFQYVNKNEMCLPGIKNIVFMGDVGCTGFLETNKTVLGKILEIETDLFVILGDMAFLGEKEEFEEIIEFCNQRVTVPIFSLPGNHDKVPVFSLSDNHDAENFSQFLGLATYALILDTFVVLALDNAMGVFEKESLTFTKNTLNKYPEKRFLITFHVPPPTDLFGACMKREEWEKLTAILDECKESIECILTGHIHGFQEYHLDGYRIFISGGGGAALYDLEKDTLKSHHAIRATFKDDASVEMNVISVTDKK